MSLGNGPNHAPRPSMEELRQAMIIPADCNGNNTTNPVMSTSSNNNHNYNNLTMSTNNNSHATRRINLGQRLPKPSELTAGNQSAASNYLALAHHSSSAAASASSKLPPPPTGGSPKRSNGTNNTHQQLIDWRTPPKPPSDSEREWQRKVETITEKYNQPSQPPHQQRSFSIIPNLTNTSQSEMLSGVHFVHNQLYANGSTITGPNNNNPLPSPQLPASPMHVGMRPVMARPMILPTAGMVPGTPSLSPMSPTSAPFVSSTTGVHYSPNSPMHGSPFRSFVPLYQNVAQTGQTQEQINELLNKITTNVINRQAAAAAASTTVSTAADVVDSRRTPTPTGSTNRRRSIGHCQSLRADILQPMRCDKEQQQQQLSPLDIVHEFDPLAQLGCVPDSPPPSYDSVAGKTEPAEAKPSPSKSAQSHQYVNVPSESKAQTVAKVREPKTPSASTSARTSIKSTDVREFEAGGVGGGGLSCLRVKERPLNKFNNELEQFCAHLKALYISSTTKDSLINLGLVFSPRIELNLYEQRTGEENKAIFIVRYHSIVWTKLLPQSSPNKAGNQNQWDFVKINCDISSNVDLLIYNVLNNMPALPDAVLDSLEKSNYLLKISDRNEYLVPNTSLDSYLYIHQCKKMNLDITLELVDCTLKELWRPFQRSERDIHFIEHSLAVQHLLPVEAAESFVSISATQICHMINNFDNAFARFLSFLPDVAYLRKERGHFNNILTQVRTMVALLSNVEPVELTKAIDYLKAIFEKDVLDRTEMDGSSDLVDKFSKAYTCMTKALAELIQIYSKAFPVNFCLDSSEVANVGSGTLSKRTTKRSASITELKNVVTLRIDVVAQLPEYLASQYHQFALRVVAYHGTCVLDARYTSHPQTPSAAIDCGYRRIEINEEVALDRIFVSDLPRESRLEFMLIGFRGPVNIGGGAAADGIASGQLLLFDFEEKLEQGLQLLPLTTLKAPVNFGTLVLGDNAMNTVAATSNLMTGWNYDPRTLMLVVRLPRYDSVDYVFPNVKQTAQAQRPQQLTTTTATTSTKQTSAASSSKPYNLMNMLLPAASRILPKDTSSSSSSYYGLYGRNINPLLRHSRGRELIAIIQKNPLEPLSDNERTLVWENRKMLVNFPGAILKILISPPAWSATCLRLVMCDVVEQYDDYPWCDSDDRRKSRSSTTTSTGNATMNRSTSVTSTTSSTSSEEGTLPFNTPIEALQLLGGEYVDTTIRQRAIHWLRKVSVDELCDYLPQLVQSLRYETYLYGSLIWLLFEQSLISVRFCHYFYWHLKNNIGGAETAFGQRCHIYLNSLMQLCGQTVALMFQKQEQLCKQLADVCAEVRAAKESNRATKLQAKLEEVKEFLESNPISIPLSPSMQVCGIELSQCSYFNSNSLPLKIVFQGAPSYHLPSSEIFSPYKHLLPQLTALEQRRLYNKIIFKCGDDLRQDMLVMQIISIINRVWLRAGRDLRLITFGVMNNAERTGMIELVSRARTLRQIQAEYGVTGNFKTHTIDTWLKRQNSEFEYRVAVENFMHSCAGYVVITYLLGICDRHNDNIMVTTTGHLFHIDFGKFLGDAQMMAGIKRDRTPFVFTTDMAYVINSGEKPSRNYHFFVDLCCECFSLIRRNGNFLLSLLAAMIPAGIGGLSAETIKYFHDALKPELSDSEAKEYFNRLIEKAHKSFFTQFNFLLHNLAQFRFSSNKESTMANYGFTNYDQSVGDGRSAGGSGGGQFDSSGGDANLDKLNSLDVAEQSGCDFSFIRQRFTRLTDGQIDRLELDNFWKKVDDSEKMYYYRVWIYRNGKRESRVYRSYREFVELSEKLVSRFEMAGLVSLPRSPKLFRSQTREVAESRCWEIKTFLGHLWSLAGEISHSDVVYTFFHQIPRDQSFIEEENDLAGGSHRGSANQLNQQLYASNVCCQIKLKLSYQRSEGKLNIFVSFAKNVRGERSYEPDSYVKLYLRPDINKTSKRKTRMITKTSFPTYMESISYEKVFDLKNKKLEVSIWEYDISGNSCIAKTNIELARVELERSPIEDWFPLEKATNS